MTKRTAAAARPASPREALAALTALRTYHDIAVVPLDQIEEATRNLELARQMRTATLLSDDEAVQAKAEDVYRQAVAKRDECFYRLWFRGLSDDDFDALVDMHPPTDEERNDGASWNRETFIPALLAACTVDSDLTEAEWAAKLAEENTPAAERRAMVSMAIAAQRQTLADSVPKG